MSLFLDIERRILGLIAGCDTLTGSKILIEDKNGLEFDLESGLGTLLAPLITIGIPGVQPSQKAMGAANMDVRVSVNLFLRPLSAVDGKAAARVPLEIVEDIIANVHGQSITDLGVRGSSFFRFDGWTISDAQDGVVQYEITFLAFLSLRMEQQTNG